MRSFYAWAAAFIVLTGIIFGVCVWADSKVPTLDVNQTVSADAGAHSYVLTGWKTSPSGAFSLTFPESLKNDAFELVFCEMNAFSLYCDGRILYTYDPAEGYQRVHPVKLPQSEDGTYNLRIVTTNIIGRNRILLAQQDNSEKIFQLAYGANMATIGMHLLIIFYCVSLYIHKRTENYFLLLAGLAIVTLISAFSNSTLSIPGVDNIAEPVRFFRTTFCAALCPILLNVRLPGKWRMLYGWPGILGYTLLLYFLYFIGLRSLSDEISYLLFIPAWLACSDGCARKEPFARIFTSGVIIREALRIFYRLVLSGVLVCPPFFYYYYIPQLSSFLFVLGSIILINGRFASKFRQADNLVVSLEEANAFLDAKVEQRTQDLKCANEQLLLAQERKHSIMMNIFHDLKTPIFAAIGSAERIRPADERSEKSLAVLEERLDFLRHMSEELFFLAKLEEGQVTFERFRVRLDDLCPPIAAGFETLAKKKNLEFLFSLEKGLMVTVDAYGLKQILENLLSNAVKYTCCGTILFRVRSEDGFALMEISDTGPGILPSDIPNLFDRYYQGNLARGPESAGLGLSIAQSIALANNGTIHVESEVGKGSTFTLKIPIEENEC